MRYPILLFALVAACGGRPGTTPSPASEREVRLLDASDVALRPVLFAAAKHVFDPNASQVLRFGGVYVNKRLVQSLTTEISSYISRNGGFRPTSRPADCERDQGTAPPAAPTAPIPTTAAATGGAPNPPAQPKRTTAKALCNGGADVNYSFTSVRIASDTAYLEMQAVGVTTSTKCLSLTVNTEAGGWTPGETKNGKVGQCGK